MDDPDAWSVLVELEGPADAELDWDEPPLQRLFELLYNTNGAAIAAGGNDVSVRISVVKGPEVTDAESAARRGQEIVLDAMREQGLEVGWSVVTLEAVTYGELEDEGQ